MKKLFVIICAFLSITFVVGCDKKNNSQVENVLESDEKTAKLSVECFDFLVGTKEYSVGGTFKCRDYVFTVESISDEDITIKVSDYGLHELNEDGSINMIDKQNEFVIKKGEYIYIGTQSEDNVQVMSISYENDSKGHEIPPVEEPVEEPAKQPVEEPIYEPEPVQTPTCEYDYMEYVWNGCYDTFQLVKPGGCGYDWEENGICYSYNCMLDGGGLDYSCQEQYPIPGENECPPGYELHEGYCFMN